MKDVAPTPLDFEYMPQRAAWLVFDLSNGDNSSKRYVWWFDTKKAALKHILWQKKYDGADLSLPIGLGNNYE